MSVGLVYNWMCFTVASFKRATKTLLSLYLYLSPLLHFHRETTSVIQSNQKKGHLLAALQNITSELPSPSRITCLIVSAYFKIGRLRTTATVGRTQGPGSSSTAHDRYHARFPSYGEYSVCFA